MDFTTFLGIVIALIVGAGLGAAVFRWRQQAAHPTALADTDALVNDRLIPLANLILYLGEQTDTRSLMRRAAEWLCAEGGAQCVIMYPFDSAANELNEPLSVGYELPPLTPRFRLGSGVFGEVASNREARFIDHISREPRFGLKAPGMETAYVTSLYYGVRLVGVLAVLADKDDAFPVERRTILDRYASVIALQALVARRFTDSQQAIARFGRFQELSLRLVERLDSKLLLQPIVQAAREMLDTAMSVLVEVHDDDVQLYPVAWSGISEETALMLRSRLKEDLKGLVAWARKPARTPDLRTDQRTARASEAVVAGMISELAVPVLYGDKLYGVLAVETDVYRNFSDEEMNLLMALAAQAGIALRNAQLFETVQSTNKQLGTALDELRASQEEIARAHEAEIRAYEAELATARAIQNSLLPQEVPPVSQVHLAARNIPARHVSGDFYQYIMLLDGKLGVAVGDVSGKGMPAALLMAVTTTALRDEIVRAPTAAGVLNELNVRLLARMQQTNMNSALVMSVFDPADNTIEIANAGMVQPYIRDGQGAWDTVQVGGYPLGASLRSNYTAQKRALPPGATVLYLSDGIIECQGAGGEFFGFERFEALLNSLPATLTPEEIVDIVIKAVYDYAGGLEMQDDITVVVMQATPHAVAESTAVAVGR